MQLTQRVVHMVAATVVDRCVGLQRRPLSLVGRSETASCEHVLMTLDHIRLNISIDHTCVRPSIDHTGGVYATPSAVGKVAVRVAMAQVRSACHHSLLQL